MLQRVTKYGVTIINYQVIGGGVSCTWDYCAPTSDMYSDCNIFQLAKAIKGDGLP
jgi:hypothetical protein